MNIHNTAKASPATLHHPTSVTTSTGTVVSVQGAPGDRRLILENDNAPADMRRIEAGRVIDGGFQPAPFSAIGLRPESLRAIADVLEGEFLVVDSTPSAPVDGATP